MEYFKRHKKALVIASALLLVFALVQWLAPKKVNTYKVSLQDYVPSLLISGEVIARGTTVVSSLRAGTVMECLAAKGDQVHKGQLLVQIDAGQARLDMEKAKAAREIAQAQLEQARTVTLESAIANNIEADLNSSQAEQQYNRVKVLAEAGAISQAELEKAKQAMETAQAKAKAARATRMAWEQNGSSLAILQAEVQQKQLEWEEKKLLFDQARIEAPADGKILDVYIRPGETVAVGTPSVLMSVGEELRIKIKPDQRYAELAKVGNLGDVWLANDAAQKYSAKVVTTDPVGDVVQGSIAAELQVYPESENLYPGQLVTVQLFGPQQNNAIVLPDKYLAALSGQSGVWITQNKRAHFMPVQIGLRTPEGVVVLEGLKAGDAVLEIANLQEGDKVQPKSEGN